MPEAKIEINRAPVLTLWAAVVAERLGFDEGEALTLGRAVAGLSAQAKGRRLGIYQPAKEGGAKARQRERGEEFTVGFFGRSIPAINTKEGVRAASKGKPTDPDSVGRYLAGKFGDHLEEAREAMEALADAYDPQELDREGYSLYEQFRPAVPPGRKGWGAKGELDLGRIRSLAGRS